jgi:hypothetical protein
VIQPITFHCPECSLTAIVPTDLAKIDQSLAQKFIADPTLSVETECQDCLAKLDRFVEWGEITADDTRVMHVICGSFHGPDTKCPLAAMN